MGGLEVSVLAGALALGLVAGVFLTFSDFVMTALQRTEGDGGWQAMQAINRQVYRSVFMVLLLGLVPAGFAVALLAGGTGGAPWFLGGAIIYAIGTMGVTMFGNVPMNKRLDGLTGTEAAAYWRVYVVRWTRLNHVRTLASAFAALAFIIGWRMI
ncbi:DUF1772 domain-containing protein [Algicella marina]|uniref:DUF1772 domain-containing protein n=1 Tax=Algicella marina TaxID=2683284 RepID=A0A6P1SUV6_9RHOB|nr:anthrone oxygenase family protein [Algicella marina]QHQ34474.1 DUF1772 domain-containing protein [Algicella marina]